MGYLRSSSILLLGLGLAACGAVTNDPIDAPGGGGTDAPGGGGDGGDIDAAADIDAPIDACVPSVGLSAQFVVNNIVGTGTSTLDRLLNHTNGMIVNFSDFNIVRGIDNSPGGSTLRTAVKSTTWMADYTGADGAFMDTEVGAFLNTGAAFMQSIFDLGGDDRVYLYILPTATNMHPYMAIYCYNAGLMQDMNGFPLVQTHTYTGCTTIFYDFRPGIQKNIMAENNTTLEVTYNSCM